jgi:ferritin-like metal-binding protein YciE
MSNAKLQTLDDLLVDQLQDLYDAEKRLTKALPKMAEAATNAQLKQAFETHLGQTEGHVDRLKTVFKLLNKRPKATPCEAMKGLIKEGEHMINADGDSDVRDAALIAAAQRVEHYEIAGYGSARTFAEQLGKAEAADLLQQTLDEEGKTDKTLTQIAQQTINRRAAAAHAA